MVSIIIDGVAGIDEHVTRSRSVVGTRSSRFRIYPSTEGLVGWKTLEMATPSGTRRFLFQGAIDLVQVDRMQTEIF